MTKKLAKEYINHYKDDTAFFDKSMTTDEMYNMLRNRMGFGEAETWVIISSLTIAGAKFKETD